MAGGEWQRNYVTLTSGERVRYALFLKDDGDVYYVRFKKPTAGYARPSTGQSKKPAAIDAAHRIIKEEYEQAPAEAEAALVTWEDAKQKLTVAMAADGKRPRTVSGYVETLDKLIVLYPEVTSPTGITEAMAQDFKARYAGRKAGRRKGRKGDGKAPNAKSLDSRVRTLKAVFGWFVTLRLVATNPFAGVEPPELDRHEVKYVKQEDIDAFFVWLEARYPDWSLPRLFFSVKAVTACRLEDLCGMRSSQLSDGRVTFTAVATKNRSERHAILPADVYAELDAQKGRVFLWERHPEGLREATIKKGHPVHRLNPEFAPKRLYLWVVALMQAYKTETGRHLTSHDFRRAAFTRAAEADIHPKRASVAFDVTAETMLRYYTATEKKRTADEVLSELQSQLLPKRIGTKEGQGRGPTEN